MKWLHVLCVAIAASLLGVLLFRDRVVYVGVVEAGYPPDTQTLLRAAVAYASVARNVSIDTIRVHDAIGFPLHPNDREAHAYTLDDTSVSHRFHVITQYLGNGIYRLDYAVHK
jgi:hypothetical protein